MSFALNGHFPRAYDDESVGFPIHTSTRVVQVFMQTFQHYTCSQDAMDALNKVSDAQRVGKFSFQLNAPVLHVARISPDSFRIVPESCVRTYVPY
jgi:hypothetical protein